MATVASAYTLESMRDVQMPTQRLGATPLVVSRLGLGLAVLGRPAYITLGRERDFGVDRSVANLERRCHETLDAAYAAGIRYVDAARSYGMAENFLGTWLKTRNVSREAITVESKWGYTYVGSWRLVAPVHEVKALSLDTLQRQIAESRTVVGDCLQLYQADGVHLKALQVEAVARRATIDALALAAALSQPWADVVLSGAVTIAQARKQSHRDHHRARAD